MKKIDGFFVTILFIFAFLAVVYYYAYSTLNYFENNSELRGRFERKKGLLSLEAKLKKIALENKAGHVGSRSIASISANKEFEISVDENMADSDELAKKNYIKAKIKCYDPNREMDCLRTIEESITHFPESDWTAESLVLLTDYYYRTKRMNHAREILEILKHDFKNNKPIQQKIIVIERRLI